LQHIIKIPMFAILFDLFLLYFCFRPVDRHVESELPENFQDIDFKDLKKQQVGFNAKWD
jgi:hypothetical protein